jgi:hypothetical protein
MIVSDENSKTSHLTLVAEGNPEKAQRDFKREFAQNKLSWAIRELASNLMRILAGGGKSYEIFPQITALIEACTACGETGAPANGFTLEQALQEAAESRLAELQSDPDPARRLTQEQIDRMYDNGQWTMERGKEVIVQAALRMVASRIVGQGTQERTAENAIFDGIRMIEEGRQQSAKYYSSPQYAENLRRERARERKERERRLAVAEAAQRQREDERNAQAQARERQRAERKEQRTRERIAGKAGRPRPKKIGIYDDLDEKERRARDDDGAH